MRKIRVALIGMKLNAQELLQKRVRDLQKEYGEGGGLDLEFLAAQHPSMVDYLPMPLPRVTELTMAQEQLLCHQSDVVIYADNGVWNRSKEVHLDRMQRESGAMLYWFDTTSEDVLSSGGDGGPLGDYEIIRPGVVAVEGDVGVLAAYLYFVVSGA